MVFILGPLVALGALTTDLYLPALPEITAELGTSSQLVQLSVAASLIGVAAGQLLGGAWSDAVGRRLPLLVGTAVHVAASLGIAVAGGIGLLLTLRVVQGVGAAMASVVAVAVARDLVSGVQLVRLLARLALFSGLAPVVAPFLGALLLYTVHWRGLFIVLGVFGAAVALLCLLALPETHRNNAAPMSHAGTRSQKERYRVVLRDRTFVGALVVGAMACAGVFAYVSAASFILKGNYGLGTSAFAVVFAVNAAAFALGSQLAAVLIVRISRQIALWSALSLWLLSGLALLVIEATGAGTAWFVSATFVFLMGSGITMPIAQVIGLAAHGEQAGTAASLMGAGSFAVAGLLAPLAAFAAPTPIAALGIALAITALVGVAAVLLALRPQLKN